MAKQPKPEPNPDQKKKVVKSAESYLKYSGMAFQMAAILIIGALAGKKLDAYYQTEKPYFTLLLVIIAIIAAFYLTLKDFIFDTDKNTRESAEEKE